jgi:hypothetical protein
VFERAKIDHAFGRAATVTGSIITGTRNIPHVNYHFMEEYSGLCNVGSAAYSEPKYPLLWNT